MKNLSILGSTGSIGVQTLDVVRSNPEDFHVCALAAQSNIDVLEQQIREFRPRLTAVADFTKYKELKERVGSLTEIIPGIEGAMASAELSEADTVVSAIVGIAGLEPTYHAILKGKNIALANKETLVTGGSIIIEAVKRMGVSMMPVDSEHSAIFQSIGSNRQESIQKLILTASGGPFREKSSEALKEVTLEDALRHPNWKMGKKITVDSATLMNKGLEVIEAKWLFGVELDRIEVCVHPQSIIHSMVEFTDGSVIAQLGLPDMRLPIQYALTYPERKPMQGARLNLFEIGRLTFERPDTERFPCLSHAYEALKAGDSASVVLNGANEIAVQLFLEGRIGFTDISRLIGSALESHEARPVSGIEDIVALDLWARAKTKEIYEKRCL